MQRYKGDCLRDYKCSVYFVKNNKQKQKQSTKKNELKKPNNTKQTNKQTNKQNKQTNKTNKKTKTKKQPQQQKHKNLCILPNYFWYVPQSIIQKRSLSFVPLPSSLHT